MKKLNFKKNKRGAIGIIIFFIALLLVIVLGFVGALITGVLGIAGDEIINVVGQIGVVNYSDTSSTNISEVGLSIGNPINDIIQGFSWMIGFAYVAALIFSIVFVVSYNYNPNPIYMGLYIILIFFCILGAIIVSNSFEQLYERNDDIALRLHEQTMLSYMILYSPAILTIIAFITGIYLFAGPRNEQGGNPSI